MLAVILEESTEELCRYLGIDFCSDLPLLTDDFFGFQLRELKSLGVTDIIFYGKPKEKYINEVAFIESNSQLSELISNVSDDCILITLSHIFFQFNNVKASEIYNALDFLSLNDDENQVCAYVLNKKLLIDFIADCKSNDSLWNRLLSEKPKKIHNADIVFSIKAASDYKKLLDFILDNRVDVSLPTVAKGIYTSGTIPEGDFVIIPPVFLGENVQIESECVIGPYTVIGDNCLIAEKTYIRNSVLFNDVYVSRGCFIDGSICAEGVSVRRDSAIFNGSALGKGVMVSEGIFIESNSHIRPFTNVSEYKNQIINYKINESCAGFYGYSPEKAALLGSSIGIIYDGAKIGVLCNKEQNAQALKFAVISGMMSTGVDCFDFGNGFLSSLLFYLRYCELDYGVYIDGDENGTMICVTDKENFFIPKDDFYSIKDKMINGVITRCSKDRIRQIRQIRGMKQIYIRNLIENINQPINISPEFRSSDKIIMQVCSSALERLRFGNIKGSIRFNINDNGTTCECEVNNKVIPYSKLKDFVSYYDTRSNDTQNRIWRNDAVFMCFKLLGIITENDLDLYSEIESIPSFYIAERVIETNRKMPYLFSRLSESIKLSMKDNEINSADDLKFKILENGNHNRIKLLARSYKAELAQELVEDAEKFLRKIDML